MKIPAPESKYRVRSAEINDPVVGVYSVRQIVDDNDRVIYTEPLCGAAGGWTIYDQLDLLRRDEQS